MARIEFAPRVLDDIDRFVEHMVRFGVENIPSRVAAIVEAIQILATSPLIGRPVKAGRRELVIGRDSRGYVALYLFVASEDRVFILAPCSQREVGFKRKG